MTSALTVTDADGRPIQTVGRRKEAIVREEVVLKKEVEERVEHVEGTVRHTEVEIERIPPEPIRFGGREDVLRESGVKGTR